MSDNIIECRDLTLAYDGALVIDRLTFDVKHGEILLVTGENGSGKSTLIKAILGLLRPVSGEIRRANGRHGIGYLPQKSESPAGFPATVREVVTSGFCGSLRCGIFLPRDAEKRISRAMRQTGVESLAERCFGELSGGQTQRVLLARALCAADSLLVLDEPTNGLDPTSAADMYSIITELRRDHGISIVMVSHDLDTAVSLADRVLHICCDGAFLCDAAEYSERVAAVHSAHGEHHGKEDRNHDRC